MATLPGYEDLFILVDEPGTTCGCQQGREVCDEGKRLAAIVTARYRNCAGLYGRRVRNEAVARWREACQELEQHIKNNHRD